MDLILDKLAHLVFMCKAFNNVIFVLPHALNQIRRYAHVQCAIASARQQIDARLYIHFVNLVVTSFRRRPESSRSNQ